MTVEQEGQGRQGQGGQRLLARFLMAARNPDTGKAAIVNPLRPEGTYETQLFERGERQKKMRYTFSL